MPRVTVLISVRNGARYLAASLRSVLVQSMREFELLVVDDGSTDATPEILHSIKDSRLRVIHRSSSSGLGAALQAGLQEARGEFIARHDADDLMYPERLALQCDVLRSDPALVLLGGRARVIDSAGRRRWTAQPPRPTTALGIDACLLFGNPFIHPTVMFRRAEVLEVGGYDERVAINEDFELWSRVCARYRATNLPQVLVQYRVHRASSTRAAGPERQERLACSVPLLMTALERSHSRVVGDAAHSSSWAKSVLGMVYGGPLLSAPDPASLLAHCQTLEQQLQARATTRQTQREVRQVFSWFLGTYLLRWLELGDRAAVFRATSEVIRREPLRSWLLVPPALGRAMRRAR